MLLPALCCFVWRLCDEHDAVQTAQAPAAPAAGTRAARSASQAARQSKQLSASYVGADTCLGCHEDKAAHARRHGPWQGGASAVTGCRAGLRDLPWSRLCAHRGSGRPDDNQAVRPEMAPRDANETCLSCHTKSHARVMGRAVRTTRAICRASPVTVSMRRSRCQGAAEEGQRTGAVRYVPPDAGHEDQARLAHAGVGRKDGVHVVPQPARLDQRASSCGWATGSMRAASRATRTSGARSCSSTRPAARAASAATTRTARTITRCLSRGRRCCVSAVTSARAIRRRSTTTRRCRRGHNRIIGRGCVNCHQSIHGSNHPSGQALTR